jgi:hypothetical protein
MPASIATSSRRRPVVRRLNLTADDLAEIEKAVPPGARAATDTGRVHVRPRRGEPSPARLRIALA